MLALEGTARQTSGARTARLSERTYDVIPDAELRDIWADFRHDSRDFVAKHGGHRKDRIGSEEQVCVTQTGRLHINENFAPNRRGNVHILEIEPVTDRV